MIIKKRTLIYVLIILGVLVIAAGIIFYGQYTGKYKTFADEVVVAPGMVQVQGEAAFTFGTATLKLPNIQLVLQRMDDSGTKATPVSMNISTDNLGKFFFNVLPGTYNLSAQKCSTVPKTDGALGIITGENICGISTTFVVSQASRTQNLVFKLGMDCPAPRACLNSGVYSSPVSGTCIVGTCAVPPPFTPVLLYDPNLASLVAKLAEVIGVNINSGTISDFLNSDQAKKLGVDTNALSFNSALSQTISNFGNTKNLEISQANTVNYNALADWNAIIMHNGPIESDRVAKIFGAILENKFEQDASPLISYNELQLTELSLKYPSLVNNVLVKVPNLFQQNYQLATKEYDQGGYNTINLSFHPTANGLDLGGEVKVTGSIKRQSVLSDLSVSYCTIKSCGNSAGLAEGQLSSHLLLDVIINFTNKNSNASFHLSKDLTSSNAKAALVASW
jgi:hypothetical protein